MFDKIQHHSYHKILNTLYDSVLSNLVSRITEHTRTLQRILKALIWGPYKQVTVITEGKEENKINSIKLEDTEVEFTDDVIFSSENPKYKLLEQVRLLRKITM